MKKRKINPQYLRSITASSVKNSPIDVLNFATSIKEFADEYLRGIMTVSIDGTPRGNVNLKLPVVTYLIRLLCETAANDTMVEAAIHLEDKLVLEARFEELEAVEDVAYMVRVAKLAGFEVARESKTFTFSAKISSTQFLKVYAATVEDFKNTLIITYKM